MLLANGVHYVISGWPVTVCGGIVGAILFHFASLVWVEIIPRSHTVAHYDITLQDF